MKAIEEINGQTARGAAIAGTAYLDLLLRRALEKQMRPDVSLQDILFQNRGALQDFSARITVAFAFKIIGPGAYLDLCRLRDIRNAFAHSIEVFDFDRDDISEICKNLWYPANVHYIGRATPKTARGLFIRAVEIIADAIMEAITSSPENMPAPKTYIQMGPAKTQPPSSPKKPKIRSSRDHQAPTRKTEK